MSNNISRSLLKFWASVSVAGVVIVALLVGALSVSSAPAAKPPTATPSGPTPTPVPVTLPHPDHIVIVIEENHSYSQIIGDPCCPYMNAQANAGANMTNFFAIEHPSQPNYLDIFSGSNQSATNDTCPPNGSPYSTANLGQELLAASLTFDGYSEDLPAVGSTVCSNLDYVRRHNAWVDFSNVPASTNLPFTSFPTDFTQLPTISFVVPNVQNDMHNGTPVQADAWLQTHLDSYIQWAKTHNSLFILTWDETTRTGGNHIPTVFEGPMVKVGQYGEMVTHFNLLRTLEDMYGLTYAGASATATPITDIWCTAPC